MLRFTTRYIFSWFNIITNIKGNHRLFRSSFSLSLSLSILLSKKMTRQLQHIFNIFLYLKNLVLFFFFALVILVYSSFEASWHNVVSRKNATRWTYYWRIGFKKVSRYKWVRVHQLYNIYDKPCYELGNVSWVMCMVYFFFLNDWLQVRSSLTSLLLSNVWRSVVHILSAPPNNAPFSTSFFFSTTKMCW